MAAVSSGAGEAEGVWARTIQGKSRAAATARRNGDFIGGAVYRNEWFSLDRH
jgi:hypothetical protein